MTVTSLPAIQVKKLAQSASTPSVIAAALQVKTTGDADVTAAPVSDATLTASANLLQTYLTASKASPPTKTSAQVNGQKAIVITQYNKNVAYVQSVAIDVATAHGDASFGNSVVTRCGFKLKKAPGGGKKPDFGITASGSGWVQVHTKKDKKGAEGHIWRVALTTAIGTPPAKADIIYFFSLECDILIQNIPSGKIIAIDHASIISVAHTKKTLGNIPLTGKKAATIAASKANHPAFSFATPDPYAWKGWIYEGVR